MLKTVPLFRDAPEAKLIPVFCDGALLRSASCCIVVLTTFTVAKVQLYVLSGHVSGDIIQVDKMLGVIGAADLVITAKNVRLAHAGDS